MRIKILAILLLFSISFVACSNKGKEDEEEKSNAGEQKNTFSLSDFYDNNPALDKAVNVQFDKMSDRQRVAQMVVQAAGRLGKPDQYIDDLIKSQSIGGVLLLNGSMDGFKQKVDHFDSLAEASGLPPLVYSADAEPSLINRKIEGSTPVPKTILLNSVNANVDAANVISADLKQIGILYDYAPVIDISPENAAIKSRSYGYDPDSVVLLAGAFMKTLQQNGIAATIKHFPGHGLVKGDTHSNLVFIDGEMKEVDTYKPLIDARVISVMVGHIAVKNNEKYGTDGMPSTCSEKIVTDLLKGELGFKGIVTTDAMNMGALKAIENVDFKAVLAGNDMILMPADEEMLIQQVLAKMEEDTAFRERIYESVKKILRMKICLGEM